MPSTKDSIQERLVDNNLSKVKDLIATDCNIKLYVCTEGTNVVGYLLLLFFTMITRSASTCLYVVFTEI